MLQFSTVFHHFCSVLIVYFLTVFTSPCLHPFYNPFSLGVSVLLVPLSFDVYLFGSHLIFPSLAIIANPPLFIFQIYPVTSFTYVWPLNLLHLLVFNHQLSFSPRCTEDDASRVSKRIRRNGFVIINRACIGFVSNVVVVLKK